MRLPSIIAVLAMTSAPLAAQGTTEPLPRPRLIILADMGNEPDEEQQMTHMLVNSNEFHLEGLIAVTGKFLNEHSGNPFKRVVHPELFHKLIDGYAKVEANLRRHAKGWPTAESLRGIVRPGQAKYGLADVGEGKASPGSELIARALLKDDPRPLNVVVNAGSNTLAQALLDLRAAHSEEALAARVRKLRVFENGAQDNCGAWICRKFPEIHWIRSNHQTYGYMGQSRNPDEPAGPYCWQPYPRTHQGQHEWAEVHIMQGHGPLGALYPYRFDGKGFLEGGGTIPWMGLVSKGLYDVDHPHWGGWSGRFTRTKQKNVWSRHKSVRRDEETYGDFYAYTEDSDTWTDPADGAVYEGPFVPVWRWRKNMLHNCRARFDWCVKPYDEANHHPVAAVDSDATDTILRRHAKAGTTLHLDASASSDPDGDALAYRWYVYPEPGTYGSNLPDVEGAGAARCALRMPQEAAGKQIHLILEVTDDSDIVTLTDYRRVVIDVAE
jgi:hypothetical protein